MGTGNLSKRKGVGAVDQDVKFLLKISRILWKNPMVAVLSTVCVFFCVHRMENESHIWSLFFIGGVFAIDFFVNGLVSPIIIFLHLI